MEDALPSKHSIQSTGSLYLLKPCEPRISSFRVNISNYLPTFRKENGFTMPQDKEKIHNEQHRRSSFTNDQS
jgi:hypothetical protein